MNTKLVVAIIETVITVAGAAVTLAKVIKDN